MELVTFKLEKGFLKEIDAIAKKMHYQNRTEFIRSALREKMQKEGLRALMGSAKETSPAEKRRRIAEMEKIRREEGEEALDRFLSKKLGLNF